MDEKRYDKLRRAVRFTGAEQHRAEKILGETFFDFEATRQRIHHQISMEPPARRATLSALLGRYPGRRKRRLYSTDLGVEKE